MIATFSFFELTIVLVMAIFVVDMGGPYGTRVSIQIRKALWVSVELKSVY